MTSSVKIIAAIAFAIVLGFGVAQAGDCGPRQGSRLNQNNNYGKGISRQQALQNARPVYD